MSSCQYFWRKADEPLMIDADYPLEIVETHILKLLKRILGESPSSMSLVELSTCHHVYSLEINESGYFLKIPKTLTAAKTLLLENGIYTGLIGKINAGIRVINYDSSLHDYPFPYLLMTKAKGISLRNIDIDRADYKNFIKSICVKIAQFHREGCKASRWGLIDADVFQKTGRCEGVFNSWEEYFFAHLHEHLKLARDLEIISSQQVGFIEKYLKSINDDRSEPVYALMHGDLGAHNIFINEKDYTVEAIIDWEEICLGDSIFDAAVFATFYRMEEFTDEIISYYCNASGLSLKNSRQRFWLYYLRMTLAKVMLRHKHGLDKSKGYSTMMPKINKALTVLKSL